MTTFPLHAGPTVLNFSTQEARAQFIRTTKVLRDLGRVAKHLREITPVVGGGATVSLGTDSRAYTVIAVSPSGKTATLQRDRAVLLNGAGSDEPDALTFSAGGFAGHTDGDQRWDITPDPEGDTIKVTRRDSWVVYRHGGFYRATADDKREGRAFVRVSWKRAGTGTTERSGSCWFGARTEHYDFNF